MLAARVGLVGVLLWGLATTLVAEAPLPLHLALSDGSPPYSFLKNGAPSGLIKDLLSSLFQRLPQYQLDLEALPWSRAQVLVQSGLKDGFATFPSEGRKAYALFSREPLFVDDYGYLIYDSGNPQASQLDTARSFEDLRGLVFVSQESVEWEKENVPAFLTRTMVNSGVALLHMTFGRKAGDFFIMSPELARHYAADLGYANQLVARKVAFIPNSLVPFHFGVRKTFPNAVVLVDEVDRAMATEAFQSEALKLRRLYLGLTR